MMEDWEYYGGMGLMPGPPLVHSSNDNEGDHTTQLLSALAHNFATGQSAGLSSFQHPNPARNGIGGFTSGSICTESHRPVETDVVQPAQTGPAAFGARGHPGQWLSLLDYPLQNHTFVPTSFDCGGQGKGAFAPRMEDSNTYPDETMTQIHLQGFQQSPEQAAAHGSPPPLFWSQPPVYSEPFSAPVSYPTPHFDSTSSHFLAQETYHDSSNAALNHCRNTEGPQSLSQVQSIQSSHHSSTNSPPFYSHRDIIHPSYSQANQQYHHHQPHLQTQDPSQPLYADTVTVNMVRRHLLDQAGYSLVQRPYGGQDIGYLPDSSGDDLTSDETSQDPYSPIAQPGLQLEAEWDVLPSPLLAASFSGSLSDSSEPALKSGEAKAKGKRGAFNPADREQTEQTRKRGACIRCQKQKIRCVPVSGDPNGDCQKCANVRGKESKKIIHHFPCLRYKLQESVLYRTGGLRLTKRWAEPVTKTLKDVGDWDGTEIRTIYWTTGNSKPVRTEVRRFKPASDDVLVRYWNDGGVLKYAQLAAYAIADVNKFAQSYMEHLNETTPDCVKQFITHESGDPLDPHKKGGLDPFVRMTYQAAWAHYQSLPDWDGNSENSEKILLGGVWKLWTAIRNMLGSAWITGDDTLGMEPIYDPSYPLGDRISIPRMIVAQFDAVNSCKILEPIKKTILKQFEKLTSRRGDHKPWWTLYFSIFVLLHTISLTSKDRHRHAQANNVKTSYSLPLFVAELQKTANVLIMHWHYYRGPVDFAELSRNLVTTPKKKNPLADFTEDETMLVLQSWHLLNEKVRAGKIELARTSRWFHHEFYFVSQMYAQYWEPLDTYQGN